MFGRDFTEILSLLCGIGLVGLLLKNSSGFATDVQAFGSAFSGVLGTATFQGSGNSQGNFNYVGYQG